MMMKCIICCGYDTGVKTDDYFVATKNGHIFHRCCVNESIAGGTPLCPICDEDLRSHPFVQLDGPPPPVPPRPADFQFRPLASGATNCLNVRENYENSVAGSSSSSANDDPRQLVEPPASEVQTISYCLEPDVSLKIVILGDMNVGKSSLLQRYTDERFDPHNMTTTCCDLRVKVLRIGGKIVRLNLWDTAGQERHRALVDMHLRRADGIIFCFDITDLATFISLQDYWYQFAQRNLPPDCLKIIVGNKLDLWSKHVDCSAQFQSLADHWDAQCIYTSAKDGTNVDAVFRSLAALILEKWLPSTISYSSEPSAPPMPLKQQGGNIYRINVSAVTIKLSSPKKRKKMKARNCCSAL